MGTDEVRSVQLYLDGQPLDGIKEIELEQAKPDDEPVEPLRTADALTLESTLAPEKVEAIVATVKPVIDTIVQTFQKLAD